MQKCGFPWILWSHFESVTLNQVGVDQNGEVVTKSAEYSKYEELVTIVQKYEEVMTKSAWYHVSISYIPTSGNWQNIALLAFLAKSMFMFTLFLAFDPTIFIFHRSKHYIRHQKFVILTRIAGIPLLLIKAVVLAGLKDKIHVPGPALFNSKSHRQISGVCIVVESSIANSN